jgi:hypothetical protein
MERVRGHSGAISENPASRERPFDERRERPAKRMLSLEDEQRILENAPPYLKVAIEEKWRARGDSNSRPSA